MRLSILITVFLLSFITLLSQTSEDFGKLSNMEKSLQVYEKDPTANAIVLYEKGNNYFKVIDQSIRLVKEYHIKIKILNENGFDVGTISIPYYHNGRTTEKITKIKAVTHIGDNQYYILPEQIFTTDLSEKWKETRFTFPKLQEGCILEYSYTLTSPYIYNFNGWDFQSPIPKVYSEFNATIPGYYRYNRNLNGNLPLSTNEASIKKNCFDIPGNSNEVSCEILKYAMKDIPAFKIEEDYMLAASNYISRIDFELSELQRLDGAIEKYTKTWNDVDKEFKTDKNIGKQLSKKNFFEKNVPENLLIEGNVMERAKNIYGFVQGHYTWNKKFGIFQKARVKEAFENKVGNVAEINMSLINLLNAAGIETKLMLSSTRQQGLPKTTHPVMSDFNYFLAKVEIDGKDYLLDATDKFLPFGMLPFRALNHYGRVMDFQNESYWQDIIPWQNNIYQIRGQLNYDIVGNMAYGVLDVYNRGYNAVDLRKVIATSTKDEYVDKIEGSFTGDLKIIDHMISKERSNDEKVLERFKFEFDNVINADKVYLNPFFIRFFNHNPFTSEERNHPIDFGYPRKYKYQMSINIPDGYTVQELPENQIINLGEKMATLKFYQQQQQNQILISFDLVLNTTHFPLENYNALKQVFKHVTNIQNNSLLVLKKELAE